MATQIGVSIAHHTPKTVSAENLFTFLFPAGVLEPLHLVGKDTFKLKIKPPSCLNSERLRLLMGYKSASELGR